MEKLLNAVDWACSKIIYVVYVAIVLVGVLQVLSRYIFNYPLIWVDELSKYLFIWLTFLGVVVASRRKAHFVADFFVCLLPKVMQNYIDLVARLLSLSFLAICTWYVPKLMKITQNSISATVGIPLSWVYAGMLVGFSLTLLIEAADFYRVYLAGAGSRAKGGEKSC